MNFIENLFGYFLTTLRKDGNVVVDKRAVAKIQACPMNFYCIGIFGKALGSRVECIKKGINRRVNAFYRKKQFVLVEMKLFLFVFDLFYS